MIAEKFFMFSIMSGLMSSQQTFFSLTVRIFGALAALECVRVCVWSSELCKDSCLANKDQTTICGKRTVECVKGKRFDEVPESDYRCALRVGSIQRGENKKGRERRRQLQSVFIFNLQTS